MSLRKEAKDLTCSDGDNTEHKMCHHTAQKVEAVYPELVDNPRITQERKHVECNGLIGVLIEAVKELKEMGDIQHTSGGYQVDIFSQYLIRHMVQMLSMI